LTRRRSLWVILAVFVAAVVVVNLALRELDRHTRSPGGPASSSFATAPDGAAAYAELLRRNHRPVLQLRDRLEKATLDPHATVVVLEPGPSMSREDGRALERFVDAGGRAVVGGDPTGWLGNVVDRPPGWQPEAAPDARAVDVAGVRTVRTAGEGAWVEPGGRRVVVTAAGDPIVVERRLGRGSLVLAADPSPLQNRLLGEADNAALGLRLAGDRPVVFAESVHGYGTASGLAAIPARWWWVLGGLLLAAVVLAYSRGRRLGPPELPWRELPPARVEFAEALATQLGKARPRADAVRTARRVARARLERLLVLPPGSTDGEIRARAVAKGVDAEAVDAVLGEGLGDEDLVAVGRALHAAEREGAIA
jgi:Domain of unknown function (DUF4350)